MRRLVKQWVEDAVADFLIQRRDGEGVELRMWIEKECPVVATKDVSAVVQGEDT